MKRTTFLATLLASIFAPKIFAKELEKEPVFNVEYLRKMRDRLRPNINFFNPYTAYIGRHFIDIGDNRIYIKRDIDCWIVQRPENDFAIEKEFRNKDLEKRFINISRDCRIMEKLVK